MRLGVRIFFQGTLNNIMFFFSFVRREGQGWPLGMQLIPQNDTTLSLHQCDKLVSFIASFAQCSLIIINFYQIKFTNFCLFSPSYRDVLFVIGDNKYC